ncbi:hypothetical protein LNQ52_27465 [Klebsiella pneumoniae subsp. pneumoniae]|nr:hypothetical protein [Klebsiella pneumoniae subsp. pneumoniae]
MRDVVGQRTGGRFVVNPDDTTSGEIPGGILVDVLGRRSVSPGGICQL